jgi:hypothetical protein
MERAMSAIEGEQSRLLEVQLRDVERLRMQLRAATGICMVFGVAGGIQAATDRAGAGIAGN